MSPVDRTMLDIAVARTVRDLAVAAVRTGTRALCCERATTTYVCGCSPPRARMLCARCQLNHESAHWAMPRYAAVCLVCEQDALPDGRLLAQKLDIPADDTVLRSHIANPALDTIRLRHLWVCQTCYQHGRHAQ